MRTYLARWVLPISRPPIPDGAVAVDQGRIAWVGPASEAPAGTRVDLGDAVLLPGLINVHTHLELTVMRGWLEDLPFRRWIIRLTKARRDVLDHDRLLASARVGIAEGLLAGVTTYADTCESGVVHEALRSMSVRGVMYQEVFGPHAEQCDHAMADLREKMARLRQQDTGLVRSGVSPHAPYSVSDTLFSAVSAYARAEALPVAIHAAESDAEASLVGEATGAFANALRARGIVVAPRGRSTVDLLERCGALACRPLLIHCVRVDGDDIRRIADAGATVAHCPASNAKLGHGVAPLLAMLEAGVTVGVGSDSVASNNRMDPLEETRLAVLLQRARSGRHDALPARQALLLATLDAARAVGLGDEVGSLDVGKAADLAAFALDGARTTPTYDPEGALVFALSGNPARFVAVNGMEVVRDGTIVADIASDRAVVEEAARDLAQFAADAV